MRTSKDYIATANVGVTSKRYLMLGILCLINLTDAIQFLEYSSIANLVTNYYQVSFSTVSLTAAIANVGSVVSVYPAAKILEAYGMRFTLVIGSAIVILAAVLKCFVVNKSLFALILFAQFVAGVAFNFCFNVAPYMAAKWFRNNEASLVIGISSCMGNLACSTCYILPSLFEQAKTDIQLANGLSYLSITMAVVSTICFFLVIVYIEEKPRQVANNAESRRFQNRESDTNSILNLLKNKNFILVSLSLICVLTVKVSLNILFNQIFFELFTDLAKITTISGILYNVSTIFATIIFPPILDRTKRFRLLTYSTHLAALMAAILFFIASRLRITFFIYLTAFLCGLFLFGQQVFLMDLIVELTYPFPESTSVGLVVSISYLPSFGYTPFVSFIMEKFGILYAFLLLTMTLFLGFVPLLFVSFQLRRNQAENETIPLIE
ncbi:hypothetical protein B4U79_17228 [Dinothrombium tinctorium]|uniref:Major facilitator superfamily (MFS) profile domain-containing protein n=1 Tax=Dinothrombium tinctorium TaxID=1965070 RepID=A0A3S3Q7I7_9ACAR|nr:hypothetical protein B4U79_17243 [Dinothrombium tinctorium]RWS15383.1 hypothetical protein B4U79_17229 [Dinothrombium tinctorium]RWS15387.1 hypothetical protein B4U79_17228 [Dinothrombium tinctorium]